MKAIIFSLLFLPLFSFAQQDTIIKQKEEYCMIISSPILLSNKISITIDYGQGIKLLSGQEQRLKDASGKIVNFNSIIEALNFMSKQGWVFVNAYALDNEGGIYHYILKRSL